MFHLPIPKARSLGVYGTGSRQGREIRMNHYKSYKNVLPAKLKKHDSIHKKLKNIFSKSGFNSYSVSAVTTQGPPSGRVSYIKFTYIGIGYNEELKNHPQFDKSLSQIKEN